MNGQFEEFGNCGFNMSKNLNDQWTKKADNRQDTCKNVGSFSSHPATLIESKQCSIHPNKIHSYVKKMQVIILNSAFLLDMTK